MYTQQRGVQQPLQDPKSFLTKYGIRTERVVSEETGAPLDSKYALLVAKSGKSIRTVSPRHWEKLNRSGWIPYSVKGGQLSRLIKRDCRTAAEEHFEKARQYLQAATQATPGPEVNRLMALAEEHTNDGKAYKEIADKITRRHIAAHYAVGATWPVRWMAGKVAQVAARIFTIGSVLLGAGFGAVFGFGRLVWNAESGVWGGIKDGARLGFGLGMWTMVKSDELNSALTGKKEPEYAFPLPLLNGGVLGSRLVQPNGGPPYVPPARGDVWSNGRFTSRANDEETPDEETPEYSVPFFRNGGDGTQALRDLGASPSSRENGATPSTTHYVTGENVNRAPQRIVRVPGNELQYGDIQAEPPSTSGGQGVNRAQPAVNGDRQTPPPPYPGGLRVLPNGAIVGNGETYV